MPLRAAVIPLGRTLLTGSSDLPGSLTERAAPPPLFGLAPRGVYPASRIAPAAVRSYRTFSPLPPKGRYIFCGTFRKARFERAPPAVSRHAALWRPDFPPGPLPHRRESQLQKRFATEPRLSGSDPSDHPSGQPQVTLSQTAASMSSNEESRQAIESGARRVVRPRITAKHGESFTVTFQGR